MTQNKHSLFSRERYARNRRHRRSGLNRWLGNALLIVFVAPALVLAVYRFVPPPLTPLMVIRLFEGHGLSKDWVPLTRISPNLQRAVIASEDAKFCQHHGFDWEAVDNAIERNAKGRRTVGASTISMQTSKNLLLWPGRNFIRKGLEAYLTVWLEALMPKKRIMELYLNEIEWGEGIYGAETAAQTYFGVSAQHLTSQQAALMAAVLPNPLNWKADHPGPYVSERAGTIRARMESVGLCNDGPCN